MLLFRVRFTIRATDRVQRLPAIHAAMVYALLCEAYGKGTGRQKGLPAQAMVMAPEQLRMHLAPGQTYACGLTLMSQTVAEADELIRGLQLGLRRHGAEESSDRHTLGGNFELAATDDLFAGTSLAHNQAPVPLSADHPLAECRTLMQRPPVVTLCFHTPLRWQLTGTGDPRKLYFDRRHFDAARFLQKVPQRLTDCGLDASPGPREPDYGQAAVLDNRLVWIDCDYRSGRQKKLQLSGAKGCITLRLPDDYPVHWLVWGQYLQLGWSTKFGHGAYRIQQLGPDPFACRRSQSLLELALQSDRLDLHALTSHTSPAAVQDATEKMEVGPDNSGCGVPTGAPLSPVLANMFLDHFDEVIRSEQGWLVRYADDFLILTRTRESADALFEAARGAAGDLLLKLNDGKQQVLNLTEPFQFLGFRFEKRRDWQLRPGQSPVEVQRLGWHDASRDRPDYATKFLLPGESHSSTALAGTTCIVDEDAAWLGVENRCLVVEDAAGSRRSGPTVDSVHQLLVTGCVTLDALLWKAIRQHNISLLMADEAGNILMEWLPDDAARSAELLTAQVDAARDPQQRLAIARQLISAKLLNYAGLAQVIPVRSGWDKTSGRLRELSASAAQATSVEQLLGYERAAAAAWYGSLSDRLPTRFPFPGRQAPKAHDPVNVLLNIAQTHVYRQARLALRLHGLDPAVGVLHTASPGHAALASDLQEVFRMLADRAAIETAWKAQHRDFRDDEYGHYPLVATATIRLRLLKTLHQSFSQTSISEGSGEPYSFRSHLLRLARSLKTVLLQGSGDLRVYRCPCPTPAIRNTSKPK